MQLAVAIFFHIRFCFCIFRAKLDGNSKLLDFTEKLEAACIASVESGKMTKDLAILTHGPE